MFARKLILTLAVATMLLLAGCASTGLRLSDAEDRSTVVEDVSISVDREETVTMAVTYASAPTITEQTCRWNPATKTTVCDRYWDHPVNITDSRLTLSTDAEETADDRVVTPVSQRGNTVTFEYEVGAVNEVTIESTVVGTEDGHEWGASTFGFEVDPASRDYLVSNSTWYDETF